MVHFAAMFAIRVSCARQVTTTVEKDATGMHALNVELMTHHNYHKMKF